MLPFILLTRDAARCTFEGRRNNSSRRGRANDEWKFDRRVACTSSCKTARKAYRKERRCLLPVLMQLNSCHPREVCCCSYTSSLLLLKPTDRYGDEGVVAIIALDATVHAPSRRRPCHDGCGTHLVARCGVCCSAKCTYYFVVRKQKMVTNFVESERKIHIMYILASSRSSSA